MSPSILMACGCRAQGTVNGEPGCVIHGVTTLAEQPDLADRLAVCGQNGKYGCKARDVEHGKPSSLDLAFFVYRGGPQPTHTCATCGLSTWAHSDRGRDPKACDDYVEQYGPPAATDRFYCGCWGWD